MSEQDKELQTNEEEVVEQTETKVEKTADEVSAEKRAGLVGWKEGGSKTAEEFLQNREEHLGLANSNIKTLEGKIGDLTSTMSAMAKHMSEKEKADIKTGYNRGISEYKAKMRTAADEGDSESYQQAEKVVENLERERDEKLDKHESIAPKSADEPNPIVAMVQAHQRSNPELFVTRDMSEAWIKEVQYQGNLSPELTPTQVFAKADTIMIDKFDLGRSMPGPDENKKEKAAAKNDGAMTFNQLSKEDKAAYELFKRDMPDYTKEKYMEIYNAN